jgi:hypothetical protein
MVEKLQSLKYIFEILKFRDIGILKIFVSKYLIF